jgi:phosphotransferase system  glucose/maltose/N-acetylglucosamine-specific IIC component
MKKLIKIIISIVVFTSTISLIFCALLPVMITVQNTGKPISTFYGLSFIFLLSLVITSYVAFGLYVVNNKKLWMSIEELNKEQQKAVEMSKKALKIYESYKNRLIELDNKNLK